MTDFWVVEWSKKQNALHIQELRVAMETNLSAFIGNESIDYIQLYQGSREQCDRMIVQIRERLIQRDKSTSIRGICRENRRS